MKQARHKKTDTLECIIWTYGNNVYSTCIRFLNSPGSLFIDCNFNARTFNTLEELALNLELKFSGSSFDIDGFCSHQAVIGTINGIPQEVLRDCFVNGKSLL
jgi:hypothetical protein